MPAVLPFKAPPATSVTWDEYQKLDTASPLRLEYVNGQIYAMAGSTDNHNRISLNVAAELRHALKGNKCEPFATDMKLRIKLGLEELGYYPDVMVICQKSDRNPNYRTQPTVLIEILSKSTRRTDQGEKFKAYQLIESLEVYVMLEQTCKRACIHRRSNNWWPEIIEGDDAVLTLDEIDTKLKFEDIYARVDWSVEEPVPEPEVD
jgi:Uma2 family endonuclease